MDYAAARANMVDGQLRTNTVTDERVLRAFEVVPRELFLPESRRPVAYIDEDLEIAPGRYMMEPRVLARLLQAAEIGPGDVVLEIGAASGYTAAVLSHLGETIVALESDSALAAAGGRVLGELGIDNVVSVEGPLAEGHPPQAPYNVIVIDGAVEEVPAAVAEQLAEGGRLVTVRQRPGEQGRAIFMARHGGVVSSRVLFDAAVPVLPPFAGRQGFVF